jgi:hypothetical protein
MHRKETVHSAGFPTFASVSPVRKLAFAGLFIIAIYIVIRLRPWYMEDCFGGKQFEISVFSAFQNPAIKESSGICPDGSGHFFTMNDDSDSCLYRFGLAGEDLGSFCLSAGNQDWEEICRAPDGRIFVGDFGNNLNRRKNLQILITRAEKEGKPEILQFRYPEQIQHPPLNPFTWDFDCEAMVFEHDSLWLFTKNKDGKSSGLYVLPAKPGTFAAVKVAEIPLQGTVTAATLLPDGRELALLVYRKIYFFSLRNGLREIASPDICLSAPQIRQSEAICYISRDSLLLSNEQGQLFLLKRK